MGDLISKALLTGLGLASLTTEAIKKTAEDLASRSNLSEEEGRRLFKELQKRSGEAQKALEKKVEKVVHEVLGKLNLTTIPKAQQAAKSAKAKASRPAKRSRSAARKA
jgi:polyhydroxyalkanoate synthesis regulator phasin